MRLGERCDACGLCASELDPNEHEAVDPCLGLLPGVAFACCGHGEQEGYIAFGTPAGPHRTIRFGGVTTVEQWPPVAERSAHRRRSPIRAGSYSWRLDIADQGARSA